MVVSPNGMRLFRIGEAEGISALLTDREPWLRQVLAWAEGEDVRNETMERVVLLRSVPFFGSIPAEHLIPLAEITQATTFERGELIFTEGDAAQHLYVIDQGSVEVLKSGTRVAVLGERECFGEMALLDDDVRSATVRAIDEVHTLSIQSEDFHELLDLSPALARGVLRVLTRRLRHTTRTTTGQVPRVTAPPPE